jgi:hypothetical protein
MRHRARYGRLQHALAINLPGNKLEPMAENDETPTVTIEVEMADSSEEPEAHLSQ